MYYDVHSSLFHIHLFLIFVPKISVWLQIAILFVPEQFIFDFIKINNYKDYSLDCLEIHRPLKVMCIVCNRQNMNDKSNKNCMDRKTYNPTIIITFYLTEAIQK